MCGISGVFFPSGDKNHYTESVMKMNSFIKHRGPDDSGLIVENNAVLAHRRLSIIDLSNNAHQPMVYMDRYVITYNGEIYNYLELKKELLNKGYRFSSLSDTEVILAAYAEWKEACVTHFNGMFAFAIYDRKDDSLFLARDRTGVKPLYYYQNNSNALFFFSEIKQAIFPNIAPSIPNNEAIYDYLCFQFSLSHETFFKGILKLLPGHYAKISLKTSLSIIKYWSIDGIEIDDSINTTNAVNTIKELVNDSVLLRLRTDVPIGAYLSGGIDSSIISSIAAKHIGGIDTFTFTSKGNAKTDESILAKSTSLQIHSKHHEFDNKELPIFKLWKESIYYMDEPEVGYSIIPQMILSKLVSNHVKVVLGGQGGDELFYGYDWHSRLMGNPLISFNDGNKLDQLAIFIRRLLSSNSKYIFNSIRPIFTNNIFNASESYFSIWSSFGCANLLPNRSHYKDRLKEKLAFNNSLLSIKKFEYKYWLQGLLHVEDRSSMYASIESRVPLLDYRIAEYVFKLPPTLNIDGILNKTILKKAFSHLLIKPVLENREKKGFTVPLSTWLIEKDIDSFLVETLNNPHSFINEIIPLKNKKLLSCRQKWMLISLELWHKLFVQKTIHV